MGANTILLAGDYRKIQSLSLAAGQTPKPGMLVMLDSAGALTVHATQGGYAEKMILLEDALQGKTTADAYTASTVADAAIALPGCEAQVLIKATSNIAIGDKLTSAGDGKFEEAGQGDVVLAVATAACDLSGSGAVDTLCNARFI